MNLTFFKYFFNKKRIFSNVSIILICLLFYTYIDIDIYNDEYTIAGTIILFLGTSLVIIANFLRAYLIWKKNKS